MKEIYVVIEHIHTPYDNEVKVITCGTKEDAYDTADLISNKYLKNESPYIRKTPDCHIMGSFGDTYGWQMVNNKEDRFVRIQVKRNLVVLD